MKMCLLLLMSLTIGCETLNSRRPSSETLDKHIERVDFVPLNLKLRAGYALERGQLKACVLYLQGLGDSILNHDPYFSVLTGSGYRIIFFDYMGQGGSEGSMNDTRIQVQLPADATEIMIRKYHQQKKYYAISEQGEYIWNQFKDVKSVIGQDCNSSKKIVIGWSTGGLSAYRMAFEKKADAVVLIAPGIQPKFFVGESQSAKYMIWPSFEVITERTLTRNVFKGKKNPHVDKVKPSNPFAIPQFAGNLKLVSIHSAQWKIDPAIKGLVFLSGQEDSYVDRDSTKEILAKNADHFSIRSYEGALHELDNELPEVTNDLYARTLQFLNQVAQ